LYGYFTLRTGSQADIAHISAALQNWHPVAQNLDSFAFSLRRESKHDGWRPYTNKQGQLATTEVVKNLLVLEPSKYSADKIQRYLAAQTATLPALSAGGSAAAALNAGAAAPVEVESDSDVPDGEQEDRNPQEVLDGAFSEQHECHSVFVQFDRDSNQYLYVLRCEGAHNFTLATTEFFERIGYETDKWQVNAKVIKFSPALTLTIDELDNVVALERGK
jgi:hypothetical protein